MKLIWKSQNTDNHPDFIDGILSTRSEEKKLLLNLPNKQLIGVKATNHAECLNAEIAESDFILWDNENFEELKSLSPIKHDYGWIFISINIPIYIRIEEINDLQKIEGIRFEGVYSENLSLLKEIAQAQK